MLNNYLVLAVHRPEEQRENESECFLTLTDKNIQSGNRYYVRLFYDNAKVDWQVGDSVMLEIGLCAYKTDGLWHLSHSRDAISLIDVENKGDNKYIVETSNSHLQ